MGLPVSKENPDGTKTVWLHQPGSYTAGDSALTDFTPSSSYDPSTSNRYWRTVVFHGRAAASGTISTFGTGSGNAIDSIYMEKDKSLLEITIRGYQGQIIRQETHVFVGSTSTAASNANTTNYTEIDWADSEYKAEWGHRLHRSKSIRTKTESYDVTNTMSVGRLATQVNQIGQKFEYEYDELGRVDQVTLLDSSDTAERSTVTWYNAAGDVTATAKVPGKLTSIPASPSSLTATPRLVSETEYDNAGRVTEHTDKNGVVTEFDYVKVGDFYREFDTKQDVPDPTDPTSTVVATKTEKTFLDGNLESITGDAVIPIYYDYTIETGGKVTVRESIATSSSVRWTQSTADWLGRVTENKTPKYSTGTLSETFEYYQSGNDGNSGKLRKMSQPGQYPTFFEYDDLGQLSKEGLDYDNDGYLTPGTSIESSSDRIKEYETKVVDFSSAKFLESSVYGYPIDDDSTKILLSRSRDRLTGFSSQTVSRYASSEWVNAEKYV